MLTAMPRWKWARMFPWPSARKKSRSARRHPAKTLNAIEGRVIDLGYFGKDSLYRVKLAFSALVRVNRVNDQRGARNRTGRPMGGQGLAFL